MADTSRKGDRTSDEDVESLFDDIGHIPVLDRYQGGQHKETPAATDDSTTDTAQQV